MIFQLPDQYESICRRAFFVCGAKLNKTFKTNIIEILNLIMCIPRKINFLQSGRYGRLGEQRYRQTFRKEFDWLCFNMNLAADRFQHWMRRLAIIRDAMMLRAVQTHNATELKASDMNLSQWWLSVLKRYSPDLLKITPLP